GVRQPFSIKLTMPVICNPTGNYISSIDLSSCSGQSIPTSAKLERKRCDGVRRKGMFFRSLVTQYTHRSPTLSFWCPPHIALEQGTSRRISQAMHFFCTRASSHEH